MRTFSEATNHLLRNALSDADDQAVALLLASTVGLAHDGTLEVDEHGLLPKGTPLPLGITRSVDGTYLLGCYTDLLAVSAPAAPTIGVTTSVVAITGDDLVMLAAANHVGIHVNPGSDDQLVLGAARTRELAEDIRAQRAGASVRTFDEHTLVTVRSVDLQLDHDRRELLARELVARGAQQAFIASYALHEHGTEPDWFTQVVVVADDEGTADYTLREDVRRLFEFVTGTDTDSAAYDDLPQVRQVAEDFLTTRTAVSR